MNEPCCFGGWSVDRHLSAEVLGFLVEFVEDSSEFVGIADTWGRILYLNPAAQKLLGLAEYDGLTIADVFPGDSFIGHYYDVIRPELLRTGSWSGEVLMDVPGLGVVPMYVATSGRIGPGGETNGGVMFAHPLVRDDVRASPGRGSAGVLTRSAFEEDVRSVLARAAPDGEICTLVIIEVDRTPAFDAVGPDAAANVLASLGERMNRLARTIDTVGVIDSHRLGMLLRGVRSYSEALRVARMVRDTLSELPVATPSGDIAPSLRHGVAIAESGDSEVTLIQRACAMSKTTAAHADRSDIPRPLAGRPGESVTLGEFRLALSHGYVRPYAQPVVEIPSGRVVGYRGVTRWHHQRHGILPAADFIDMITDTALAAQVDFYIARETAPVLTLVARETPLRLYTPVSRRLLEDARVERYLLEIAAAFDLTPAQIHLQIPRATITDATSAFRDVLGVLADADIRLVLTDVESVRHVEDFAQHGFAEYFLSHDLTNADADAEIRRIVQAAHDRNSSVGATGVSSNQQHHNLAAAGCDLATGDAYGKPQLAHHID
jgi:EAL domain-containing protein (putative c-di-GMP-specific phosphodiesterase class I)/GGDEF domain-containing protein